MEKEAKMKNLTKTLITAAALIASTSAAAAEIAPPDASPTCAPINVTVYFAAGETALSKVATSALEAQTTNIGNCAITSVEAAAISPDDSTLSEARSAAVLSALNKLGVNTNNSASTIAQGPEGQLISSHRQVLLTMNTRPVSLSS